MIFMNKEEFKELRETIGDTIIAEVYSASFLKTYQEIVAEMEAKGKVVSKELLMKAQGNHGLIKEPNLASQHLVGIRFGVGRFLQLKAERNEKENRYVRIELESIKLNDSGNPIVYGDAVAFDLYDLSISARGPVEVEILKLTQEVPDELILLAVQPYEMTLLNVWASRGWIENG